MLFFQKNWIWKWDVKGEKDTIFGCINPCVPGMPQPSAYAAGYMMGTVYYGSSSITSYGHYDIAVAKRSYNGTWEWIQNK